MAMSRDQFLKLLGQTLPAEIPIELRESKKAPGKFYGHAEVAGNTRTGFVASGIECEGLPKVTLVFGSATPKGVKPREAKTSRAVSDVSGWAKQFGQ